MKWSISTKIFIGFAIVISAFGGTCVFTLYRMASVQRSITVLWRDVLPVRESLDLLNQRVRSTQELLALDAPSDAQFLQRALHRLLPFDILEAASGSFDRVLESDALVAEDRASLAAMSRRIGAFSRGYDLALAGTGVAASAVLPEADRLSSVSFYEQLARATMKLARTGDLQAQTPEAQALGRVMRRLERELSTLILALNRVIAEIDGHAEDQERSTTLAVAGVAIGALVLSLLILWISQLTLAPLRQLQAGVKRIAAGRYDEDVVVRARDEVGALALEFNTMAHSLRARDQELARKREELLRADRLAVIGKLAAQITHEVRNPLSSIGLNAELLEEELSDMPDAAEAESLLSAIAGEVQRLKSITEDYLQFARLPRPDLRMVDVGALVTQFLSFLRYEVAHAGVTLEVRGVKGSMEGGPPPIRADSDQIRQALLNISRNAMEAMADQPEERVLSVELEPAEAEGRVGVSLVITDTGGGIDPELRDRIFEPFVTGKSHGTGLGLALTHEIITEHGGRIIAQSPVSGSRGASFRIFLPGAGRDPESA